MSGSVTPGPPRAVTQPRPRLSPHARIVRDRIRGGHALLAPETIVRLVGSAPEILALCDGRPLAAIEAELAARHPGVDVAPDVRALLGRLSRRGWIHGFPPAESRPTPRPTRAPRYGPPQVLLAELTHRCPLRCGYCSNPTSLSPRADELDGATWRRVIEEATALGVLQVHLSGGEPLLRRDLETLVATARDAGAYTNLITSAHGLDDARLDELAEAGLDHVQISLQHVDAGAADAIAGVRAHAGKLRAAEAVRDRGLALSLNVVLLRGSIDHVAELVALAESSGAQRLELASLKLHGFARANRAALLPTESQVAAASEIASAARDRLAGALDVIFVHPDHFRAYPTRCMDGWGHRFIVVAPDGRALPCPGAYALPLGFDDVRARSLTEIWSGEPFARYRGAAFLDEPCASCDRRDVDLGGCRCQAYALTGDAARTDPACRLSPDHAAVERAKSSPADRLVRLRLPPHR